MKRSTGIRSAHTGDRPQTTGSLWIAKFAGTDARLYQASNLGLRSLASADVQKILPLEAEAVADRGFGPQILLVTGMAIASTRKD
jgi:hypothetical protein